MADTNISQKPVGEVANLTGRAEAVSEAGTRELAVGSDIFQGDTIITREASQLEIDFIDETSFRQIKCRECHSGQLRYGDQ